MIAQFNIRKYRLSMKNLSTLSLLFIGLTPALGSEDIRDQPIHNLNQTKFCFNRTLKINAGPGVGQYDTPVKGKSKNVQCSIRVYVSDSVNERIGSCEDPTDPNVKYTNDERYFNRGNAEWQKKFELEKAEWREAVKPDTAPYHTGMHFEDSQGGSVTEVVPKDKLFLSESQVSEYLKNPKLKKWKGVVKATPQMIRDPKSRKLVLDTTDRYYINNPVTTFVIKVRDPENSDYVRAILCTSKRKDFPVDRMTIGDLQDAFGGSLRMAEDPRTTPASTPDPRPTPASHTKIKKPIPSKSSSQGN